MEKLIGRYNVRIEGDNCTANRVSYYLCKVLDKDDNYKDMIRVTIDNRNGRTSFHKCLNKSLTIDELCEILQAIKEFHYGS